MRVLPPKTRRKADMGISRRLVHLTCIRENAHSRIRAEMSNLPFFCHIHTALGQSPFQALADSRDLLAILPLTVHIIVRHVKLRQPCRLRLPSGQQS